MTWVIPFLALKWTNIIIVRPEKDYNHTKKYYDYFNMDIDYNTLPDLAGADGHILNLSDYSWSLIDYRHCIFYGIVPVFGHPQSLINAVWPDYERKTIHVALPKRVFQNP